MKKIVVGALVLSVLMAGCTKDKETETANSKVEQLESRVKELESFSSSNSAEANRSNEEILSEVKSETNKKIVSAFLDNSLAMFNNGTQAVSETEDNYVSDESGYSPAYTMHFAERNDNPQLYFTVSIFNSLEDLNRAYDLKKDEGNDYFLSKNDAILALMIGEAVPKSAESEVLFNKYKEVFETIK